MSWYNEYMKSVFIAFIIVIILGVSGFFGFQYLSSHQKQPSTTSTESQNATLTGLLMPGKGDDYSYILVTDGKTVGIASQTVQLEKFANKRVEITGSFSGTTLYAYTVTEK